VTSHPEPPAQGASGERDLDRLVATMRPELRSGTFVFVTVPHAPDGIHPVAWVREQEGITLVLEKDEADRHRLPYGFVAAMITLSVHSALDAVGLTAAVSGALSYAGISCNVVAGYFHDHLFVPAEHAERATQILRQLADSAVRATPGSTGRRWEGPAAPSPSASA
jgi:hypothetical protein